MIMMMTTTMMMIIITTNNDDGKKKTVLKSLPELILYKIYPEFLTFVLFKNSILSEIVIRTE